MTGLATPVSWWSRMLHPSRSHPSSAPPLPPPHARLTVVHSFDAAHLGDVFLLDRACLRFGRSSTCVHNEINLYDDPHTSRGHGRFERRDGQWWVADIGSAGGILVNERRIDVPVALATSDRIAIGRIVLEVTLVDTPRAR